MLMDILVREKIICRKIRTYWTVGRRCYGSTSQQRSTYIKERGHLHLVREQHFSNADLYGIWQRHAHFFYAIFAFEAVSILDLLLTVLEMLSQGRTLACLALFSQLWQSLETHPSLRTPAESPTEERTSSGSSSSSSSAGVSVDSACSSELAATCFSASADFSSSAWTVVKIDEKKSAMAIVKQTSGGKGSRKC